jgi:hypothetical protein
LSNICIFPYSNKFTLKYKYSDGRIHWYCCGFGYSLPCIQAVQRSCQFYPGLHLSVGGGRCILQVLFGLRPGDDVVMPLLVLPDSAC